MNQTISASSPVHLEARSIDKPTGKCESESENELVCQACGFDSSFAPQGKMLTCETCQAAHYCSSDCRDWDRWSNGHAKVCQSVAVVSSNPTATTNSTTALELSQSSLLEASFTSHTTQPSIDANHIFINSSNHSASSMPKDFNKGPEPTSAPLAISVTTCSAKDTNAKEVAQNEKSTKSAPPDKLATGADKRRLPKSANAPSGQLGSFLDHHGPKDVSKLASNQFGFALPSQFRMSNNDDEDDDEDDNKDEEDDDLTEDGSLALSYIQNSSNDFLQSIQEESGFTTDGPVGEASWRRKSAAYTTTTLEAAGRGIHHSPTTLTEEQRQQEEDDQAYLNSPIHRLCHESTSSLTGNIDAREHNALMHLVDSTSCFSTSCNMSDLQGFEDSNGHSGSSTGLSSVQEECTTALSTREEYSESDALEPVHGEDEPSPYELASSNDRTQQSFSSSHREMDDPTFGDDESISAALNCEFSPTSTSSTSVGRRSSPMVSEPSTGKFSYLKRFRDSYNSDVSDAPSPVRADRAIQVVKQHFGTLLPAALKVPTADTTPAPPKTPPSTSSSEAEPPDLQRLSSLREFRNLYYARPGETAFDMQSHHSDTSSNSSHTTASVPLPNHDASLVTAASIDNSSSHAMQQMSHLPQITEEAAGSVGTDQAAPQTELVNISVNGESDRLRMARMRHESLKNSLNIALKVYEELHGQDAATDIFLQLTGSLNSSAATKEFTVDTLSESQGEGWGHPLGSIDNDEASEASLSMGQQDSTEISEVSTFDCMVHPREDANNLSTAARYFQYRNSLQSSISNVDSTATAEANAIEPFCILSLPIGQCSEWEQAPGRVDSDVESSEASVTRDNFDASDITSTLATAKNVLRYMQYREKLAALNSSTCKLSFVDVVKSTPDEDDESVKSDKEIAAEAVERTALQILATLPNIVSKAQHIPMKGYSQYRTELAKYDSKTTRPTRTRHRSQPATVAPRSDKTNAERIIYGVNDSLRTRTNAPEFLDLWNELESDRVDIETGMAAARSTSQLQTLNIPGSSWSLPAVTSGKNNATSHDVESGMVLTGVPSPQLRSSPFELEGGNVDPDLSDQVQTKIFDRANRSEMVRYVLLALLLIGLPLFVGMCVVMTEATNKEK